MLDTFANEEPAAFAGIARSVSGDDPDPLLLEIAQHRAAFAGRFDAAALARALGADPTLSLDALAAEVLTAEAADAVRRLLPLLPSGADCAAGVRLAAALASSEPEERLQQLEEALLTKSGQNPFTPKGFPTQAVVRAHPVLAADVALLARRCAEARPRRLALAALARSSDLNRFGRRWLAAWSGRKRRQGLLDFDDMIDRAQDLLARQGIAAWVLWKLDGGLDHILVDEAQDTSPAQWRVIEALAAEFFAGEGASRVTRTLFVVGDEKQSIYSFQGADPAEFGLKSTHYARVLSDIGQSSNAATCSIPSAPRPRSSPSSTGSSRAPPGRASPPAPPPPDRPGDARTRRALAVPAQARPRRRSRVGRLPRDLAARRPVERPRRPHRRDIAGWLASGRLLPGESPPRPIRAGDVMVLVQRRGPIFEAVIRALKRARVPVAGADLLRIGGELAVRDLLAALRFAATERDDLSLAAFLRSPLGGMSERALFDLAHPREGSLWRALREEPAHRWPEARALLSDIRAQADYLRPFELIERMLIRHGGRQRLVARLGTEAEDGIDALLDQALAYEQVEAPSLTGFLDWIDRDEVAVKRRSDAGIDQVRVMTVHGAKGLEAPIVFLPDTAVRNEGGNQPTIVRLATAASPPGAVAAPRRRPPSRPPTPSAGGCSARRTAASSTSRSPAPSAGSSSAAPARRRRAKAGTASSPTPSRAWRASRREPTPEGETLALSHNWSDATAAGAGATTADPAIPAWATLPAGRPTAPERIISPSMLGARRPLSPPCRPPPRRRRATPRSTARPRARAGPPSTRCSSISTASRRTPGPPSPRASSARTRPRFSPRPPPCSTRPASPSSSAPTASPRSTSPPRCPAGCFSAGSSGASTGWSSRRSGSSPSTSRATAPSPSARSRCPRASCASSAPIAPRSSRSGPAGRSRSRSSGPAPPA